MQSEAANRRVKPGCWTFAAAIVGLLALVTPAAAQVDTPANAAARSALKTVRDTYSARTEWNDWSTLLAVPDLDYELHAGDRGDARVLREAIRALLMGNVSEFNAEPFQRLAKALDIRAQELTPIAIAEWPSACDAEAERYEPVSVEALEQLRVEFERRIEALRDWMPSLTQPSNTWHAFLFWNESWALATAKPGPTPSHELLDRLEVRWAGAPAVWDEERLFETSLAAQTYIRALRGYLIGETREQHAEVWREVGHLLGALTPDRADTSQLAAAIHRRESLGEASRLTSSIRRELSRPNLILEVRSDWLESQLKQAIDEPYQVDGVFAGSRSVGSGRMVGTMWGEVLPSSSVGRWVLRISATSTARASGGQDRVSVVSRATTRVAATKPFRMDVRGLSPERASAGAITSIQYESIDAPGIFARRRNQAVSETYARRPQAESESASYARRSILETINKEAAKVSADFNKAYHERLRDPRISALRPAPRLRIAADGDRVAWQCLLEAPAGFGAPLAPEPYDPGTPVVMNLAASAMDEQVALSLAGKEMNSQQLAEAMGETLGKSSGTATEDFSVTFEADPCDVRFADGAIEARLKILKFDSADTKYPAMTVDMTYRPEVRDGQVVFLRQGNLRVMPAAKEGDDGPKLSGRQQTLKLAVQRKLSRVLSEELVAGDVKLPMTGDAETALVVKDARVTGPWLQMGLSPKERSAETAVSSLGSGRGR